jgi:hypothetical protein
LSDALIFTLVFGGLVLARIIAATILFAWILPRGDRCPNCDAVTMRLENGLTGRVFPWLRRSWCYECDWHGMLRVGEVTSLSESARAEGSSSVLLRGHHE